MRRLVFILAVMTASLPGHAHAADPGLIASLKHLDPATRRIQVCNLAVMDETSSTKDGVTDRAFIDALKPPEIRGGVAMGNGGAFRRGGEWYEFSYRCAVTADHMKTTDLKVHVIRQVPRSEWDAKNLYP